MISDGKKCHWHIILKCRNMKLTNTSLLRMLESDTIIGMKKHHTFYGIDIFDTICFVLAHHPATLRCNHNKKIHSNEIIQFMRGRKREPGNYSI